MGLLLAGQVPGAPSVRWIAPATCPDAATVEASVLELLGDPTALEGRVFDVFVTKTRDRYRAQMVWAGEDGELAQREFGDESCDAVAQAVGLYIAVAVDMSHEPEPRDRNQDHSRRRLGVGVGIAGTLDHGTLPSVTPGVRPSLWLSYGPLAAQLRYETWLPQSAGQAGVGVDVGGHTAGLSGCGVPKVGIVSFPICLGAEAGVLLATPSGLERNERQLRPWVAAAGSASVRVRLGRWVALIAGPEFAVAALRPRFTTVRSSGAQRVLYTPGATSVRGMLGFEFWGRR